MYVNGMIRLEKEILFASKAFYELKLFPLFCGETMQKDFPKTNYKGLGQKYSSTDLDRSSNCIIERKRGFRPSDRYDESKKQILLELSRKLWKKQNVRRSFWMDRGKISTLHINVR